MSGRTPHSGRRRVIEVGNSVALTIDAKALEEMGIEREDLLGEDVPASIDTESGQLVVDLKEA